MAGLCLLAACGALAALTSTEPVRQAAAGGTIGYVLVYAGRYYLGSMGTALLAGCVVALAWVLVVDDIAGLRRVWTWLTRWIAAWAQRPHEPAAAPDAMSVAAPRSVTVSTATPHIRSTVTPKLKTLPTPARTRQANGGFQLPSLDLLTTPPPAVARQHDDDPMINARILEEALREFGIEAHVVNIDRGPTVTRYEVAPAPGVKLTKIVALADDLALVLKAVSCHILAPIPGKGLVGIDVPNATATLVSVKEILMSREFAQLHSPLALAIGKDVSGHPMVADLRECPHLLVAGATGSGKTVCLNSILTALLYHATPDELKFLMIDPKKVELVLFNDIPHLIAPVVTDAKQASVALGWAVQEMERRYQLLAHAGVRNITAYNERCSRLKAEGSPPEADPPSAEKLLLEPGASSLGPLPYLVIVIDELADLMMIASQDVEHAITRLSQLSRAVGLHIILATQRPSVDVITGVIKANFPARIAFQVASKVDSRTILDANGADKLLGRGDLMFLRPGTAKPVRAQAAYVSDAEIERLVSYLKAQRAPTYDERLVARQQQPSDLFGGINDKDELYEMAKRLVIESGQASTSLLQRRLRLGYARAARILDVMEQEGIVGPPQGSRPREILVNRQKVESAP
jgi:S-DNA-T family DNA segregation ATPase FtsK/SpoIIIE